MALHLNSDEQREAVTTVLSVNKLVVGAISDCAGVLKGLDYDGEVKDQLFGNFTNLEKSVNANAEDLRKIESVVRENIEISEDMEKALHQMGQVNVSSASVNVQSRSVDVKGLGKFGKRK